MRRRSDWLAGEEQRLWALMVIARLAFFKGVAVYHYQNGSSDLAFGDLIILNTAEEGITPPSYTMLYNTISRP